VSRSKKGSPPAYRPHSTGQARVTVRDQQGRRRDIMLDAWQSPASKAEYQRVLALLHLHNGYYPFTDAPTDGASLTVDEIILAWIAHRVCRPFRAVAFRSQPGGDSIV